jgi:hypothetical protein
LDIQIKYLGGIMIISNFGKWIKNTVSNTAAFFERIQMGRHFDSFFYSFIVVIAFFMLGPGLNSAWGLIDDHEIMFFSPKYHPMGFSEIIPTLLTKTEMSPASTIARFRPVYTLFRLLEIRIWSTQSPFPYYFFRILIFIFFIDILYIFFKRFNGRFVGSLLALSAMTFNFWNGIFSRLGPSETFAILGCGFFLIGILIFDKVKNNIISWLIITLGTIIAVGSKENMVILLLPQFYLAYLSFRKPLKRNIFPFVMVGLSTLWSIWIMATVLLRVKAAGGDVYENSLGVFDRLAIVGNYFASNLLFTVVIGVLLITGLIGILIIKDTKLKPDFQKLMFGSAGIIILFASQVFFYSGSIWGRYNFPYALYLPLTICLAANFLQNLPIDHNKVLRNSSTLLISAIIIVFFIHPSNILINKEEAIKNVDKTLSFKSTLHDIEYYLITNRTSPIIFYGNKPDSDFERIVSYIQYIRSDSFTNKMFIYRDPPADYEKTYTKLNASLEKTLLQWSTDGYPDGAVDPINGYDITSKNCLLLNLAKTHPKTIICDSIVNIN